ncbi:sugar ABC transporter ATP-binding protein [Streptomyces chartreusis]|uniref:sugar ABC transporter ATP-binding protein n=1 Tax=Streptomyces chartreusis TaxID=1969 RepID=UPI0036B29BE7
MTAEGLTLQVEGLSKTFGPQRVLDDVNLEARAGRVHALVGGNGSGKSTLIKVLAGVHRGDSGQVRVAGSQMAAQTVTPEQSRAAGLRFVHQDPAVFGSLTVAENLAIGGAHGFPTRMGRVRWGVLRERARQLLERFEIEARPDDRMEDLRQSDRTMIAIARALQDEGEPGGATVLVLDEPTASLPEHEVETVLAAVRRCAGHRQAVVYVSHRLNEVVSIADDVTVLRDGQVVEQREATGLTTDALIEAIVGQPLNHTFVQGAGGTPGARLFEVSGLSGGPLVDVSFAVGRGEIVGIAGLLGSGRSELLRQLFGADRRDGGLVLLDDAVFEPRSTGEAIEAGVAFVPEDRALDATFADLSVVTNLSLARLQKFVGGRLRVHARAERTDAERCIAEYSVRLPRPTAPMSELSGGNQQKVVLARWLERFPRLLLLDEPTQGVDVGSRAEIYRLIRDATDGGMGTVLVSSDLEELAHAADRVVVLSQGRITAEVTRPDLSARRLTDLLYAEEDS